MTEPRSRSERIYPLVFGTALVLLLVLAIWWIVLMSRTLATEGELVRERLRLQAVVEATLLASTGARVEPGPLAGHEGFEIVPAGPGAGAPIGDTGLAVRPSPDLLAAHEERIRGQRRMVVGEGSFMVLLVGSFVILLHRLVQAERRYRRDVDHFLSRVTHEMKTPLAGVKALLESLLAGRVPEGELPRLAALGLRQAERQEHLIENLLTAHRRAGGRPAARIETLDLCALLASFVEHRCQSMALEPERFRVDCEAGLQARGDASAVLTILDNLADNADKYGASGLRLRAAREGEQVLLHIADDGQGFEPKHAEALFDAFRRGVSGSPGTRHGTGLGLHISRELAREMGGELSATSEGPGRGATFTLRLPAVSAQEAA